MLTNILNNLADYAKDIKLNYTSFVTNHSGLTDEQFYGVVLSAAMASRNMQLIDAVKAEYAGGLSEGTINGVKASVAMMSMTNVYYKFTHIIDSESYKTMSAGLRMNIMREPGIDKIDFEIYCTVVSIINGCGMCITAHEKQLIKHGVSQETVQLLAKIASVVHSLAVITEIS